MRQRPIIPSVLAVVLFLAASGSQAQTRTFDIGSMFDAAKSLVKSQSVGSMSEEEELSIGKEVVAATLGGYPLVRNPGLQHRLNQIGVWVALQSSRPELPWRFAAVQSPAINAFAAPGGTILVTEGMLGHVANEAAKKPAGVGRRQCAQHPVEVGRQRRISQGPDWREQGNLHARPRPQFGA
jgi:predicted Zn-dependent protease